MVDVVSHAEADVHRALDRYASAFADDSSIAVVAPERVDAMRSRPWLDGWYVTDCTSRFEPATAPSSGDELIFETSGTVADPKMVRYGKSTIRDCGAAIAQSLSLDPDREYLSLANPRFAYGLSIVHSHSLARVPVHFTTLPVGQEPRAALLDRLTPKSSVYLLPQHSFLLGGDASRPIEGAIQFIFAGGALTQSMVDRLKLYFPNAVITNMYGQAELGPRIAVGTTTIGSFREGNVGRPLPGVEIKIGDDDAAHRSGPLLVNSPFRMAGYVTATGDEPTATLGMADAHWWPTGDTGYVADDGDVHVLGRSAAEDLNLLGERVRLRDITTIARAVRGVLDARVTAAPHRVYGQRPVLRVLVEAVDGSHEQAVRDALFDAMGDKAGATLITVVDLASLPASGKL